MSCINVDIEARFHIFFTIVKAEFPDRILRYRLNLIGLAVTFCILNLLACQTHAIPKDTTSGSNLYLHEVVSPIGPLMREVKMSDSIMLSVRALPNAKVHYTSYDLGSFNNGRTKQTVLADKEGIASTMFIATKGTVEDVNIVVNSPSCKGLVHFVVTVVNSSK